ncbi:MAG TPA: hypothetical protein VK540_13815 [Polyangiaceae bacterium]|nr:hypothetical protein [Polyangiaceae bacterium]
MRILKIVLSITSLAALASGPGGCGSDSDPGSKGGSSGAGGSGGSATGGSGGTGTGGATGGSGGTGATGGSGATGGAAGTGGTGGTGATGGTAGSGGASGSGGAAGSGGTAGKGGASGSSGAAGSAGKAGAAGSGGVTDGGAGSGGAAGTDGGGAAGSSGAGGAPEGGACVGDYVSGDYPPAVDDANAWLTISGVTGQPGPRQYKVHVPPSYDCRVPMPVLFCIHGLQQNGVMFCVNGTSGKTSGAKGFVDKSNEAGFILVAPNGYMSSWNGGTGHYGAAASMGLDDVGLMKAIFAELKTHVNVDTKKVFAAGLSNGAYMSYRLGCEAADIFTAVAPGAGGIVDKTGCSPSRPMSVLDIHGTMDSLVPFSEQVPSADAIATKNGCTTMTTAATVPASGGDTTCVTYSGCPSGIEVTRCAIQGGGHVWFGDPSCGTGAGAAGCVFVGANSTFLNNTDVVWDFFKRLSR